MGIQNERCGFVPPTPGFKPCTRPKGHSGPCAHPEELSLAELLEMRGDVTVERDANGKPVSLILGGAASSRDFKRMQDYGDQSKW